MNVLTDVLTACDDLHMNRNADTSAVMAQTSTAVLVDAARRLMAVTARTVDEDRVLGWTLEELMARDPAMRRAVRAAVA